MYYVLLPDLATRTAFIDKLRRAEITRCSITFRCTVPRRGDAMRGHMANRR